MTRHRKLVDGAELVDAAELVERSHTVSLIVDVMLHERDTWRHKSDVERRRDADRVAFALWAVHNGSISDGTGRGTDREARDG